MCIRDRCYRFPLISVYLNMSVTNALTYLLSLADIHGQFSDVFLLLKSISERRSEHTTWQPIWPVQKKIYRMQVLTDSTAISQRNGWLLFLIIYYKHTFLDTYSFVCFVLGALIVFRKLLIVFRHMNQWNVFSLI